MKKAILLFFALGSMVLAKAQSRAEVQAMLITSISKYVEWTEVSGDFNIVVIGETEVMERLKKYMGTKPFKGANVVIVAGTKSQNFDGVEMLISPRTHVAMPNVLTINLDGVNGVMNFVEEDGKIKIKIRKTLAEANKLKLASALTSMITIID